MNKDLFNQYNPILLSFPLVNKNKNKINLQLKNDENLSYLPHQKKRKLVEGEDNTYFYRSDPINQEQNSSLNQYLLFLYNKKNDEIILSNKINLKNIKIIKKNEKIKKKKKDIFNNLINNETSLTTKQELTQKFGSKKNKRKLKNFQEKKLIYEVSSSLTNSIKNSNLNLELKENEQEGKEGGEYEPKSSTDDALLKTRREYLPKFNKNAKTFKTIYPWKTLIPKNIYNNLNDYTNQIITGCNIDGESGDWQSILGLNMIPLFVLNELNKIKLKEYEKNTPHILRLIYLRHLIIFNDIRYKINSNISLISETKGIPLFLLNFLLDTYASKKRNSYFKTDSKTKKLILLILIIAISINDYHIEPKQISNELGLKPIQVKDYYKELGCHILFDKDTNSSFVELKLPLKFPKRRYKK